MARTQVKEQVAFQEVRSNAVSLFVSQQGGNHADSMALLSKNDLRPLTHQEALSRSSELITELKGKWFYLDGQGTEKSGIYTFNDKGELVAPTGNESIDQKVRVWSGNRPLSLYVGSDGFARYGGRRFILYANASPYYVAPVVVGVKLQAGSVTDEQKVDATLVSSFRAIVDDMQTVNEGSTPPRTFTPGELDVFRNVLRVIEE